MEGDFYSINEEVTSYVLDRSLLTSTKQINDPYVANDIEVNIYIFVFN